MILGNFDRSTFLRGMLCVDNNARSAARWTRSPSFYSGEEPRQRHAQPIGDDLQIDQAGVAFPLLDLAHVAAVQAKMLGQLELTPSTFLAQNAQPVSEYCFYILMHAAIFSVRAMIGNGL